MRQSEAFDNGISGARRVLGWIYLPVHIFLLPLLLSLLAAVWPGGMSGGTINLVYYAVGVVFVLLVFFPVLRRDFDTLADYPGRTVLAMLGGGLMEYVLSLAAAAVILLLVGTDAANPNNDAVMDAVGADAGTMRAIAFFLAPLVEEVLFRGVLFGSVRRSSRVWAYALSVAVFSLYHVWQYVVVYGDPRMLLYALQYIPVSVALAWTYERSGTLWGSTFLHMILNFISYTVLSMV